MIFYEPKRKSEPKITDLSPERAMDPYKPCWCGSGKKWKWCHKDREKQRPPAFEELNTKMLIEAQRGFCMHPQAPSGCSQKIVRAHTVQKNGGLSQIQENGHVLSPKEGSHALGKNGGRLEPRKIGVNNASTFMGFCSTHDTELFRVAEHNLATFNDEVAFVLAYRAMAYEYFAKTIAEKWADIQRQADCGQPFERQVEIQKMTDWVLQGTRLALQDFAKEKSKFDLAWANSDYENFGYFAVEFDSILPVVGCGGFAPEFDFDGATRQYMGVPDLEHIYFNWTVLNCSSIAIIAWLGKPDGHAHKFVESFKRLGESEFADGLLRLVFEHVENIYFKPSWWNGLSEDIKKKLVSKLRNGTLSGERTKAGLLPMDFKLFDDVTALNTYEKLDLQSGQ